MEWSGARRVLVVGHSLGGTVALTLASRGHPLLPALGIFESPMPWLPGYRGSVGGDAVEIGRVEGPAAAAEFFLRGMIGDAAWERMRPADQAVRRAEGRALMAELIDLRRPQTRVELDSVRIPVTVGTGGRSRPNLRYAAIELARNLPDPELVELPDAVHGAHLARPDDFAGFVCSALARVER